tara:strand:- start:2178 stop:2405 length:228 start_codon:yes stop_codon:yes gene_type:complete
MINAFNRFQALTPNATLTVVTIVTNNSDGTSTATTLAGVTVTVIGESVTPNNKAFTRNGEIVRQAPNLTVTELAI